MAPRRAPKRRPAYRRRPVRPYRRVVRRTRRAPTLYRNPQPLQTIKNFVYSESLSFGNGTDAYAGALYSTNSLFSPRVAAGGHQPMFFDQFCGATGLYQAYKVIKSSITVMFMFNYAATNTSGNTLVMVDTTDNSTIDTVLSAAVERPGTMARLMPLQTSRRMRAGWNLRRAQKFADDSQWASGYATSPTTQNYFRIQVFNPITTTPITSACIEAVVRISYTAVLSSPSLMAQS